MTAPAIGSQPRVNGQWVPMEPDASVSAESEAIGALHAQMETEYEQAREASVLSANAKTLAAFIKAMNTAQSLGKKDGVGEEEGAEDDAGFDASSWEAMLLIPRLAVLDCLRDVVYEGTLPLELFHAEPGLAPEAERAAEAKMEALRGAALQFLSSNSDSVAILQAHLRSRLLDEPICAQVDAQKLTRVFDALCGVSDVPMTDRARDTTLLLQHTFQSP